MRGKQQRNGKPGAASAQAASAVLLLWALVLGGAGVAQGQSLAQVVEGTLKGHPRVTAAAAQRRAAVAEVTQARAGYFPSVDVNLGDGREHTDTPQTRVLGADTSKLTRREAGVVVTQMLFDGLATRSEVERQTARVEVAAARLAEVGEEIALKAVGAYLEVLKNRELVRLGNDNLRAHLATQDKVRLRVQGGVSQRSDLQQAQGRIALAKSTASARAGQLREAEANFRTVVGQAPGALQDPGVKATETLQAGVIDLARLNQFIAQSSALALETNPTLNAANAEVTAAEALVRGSKAPYYPRLNLELSASRNQNISGIPGDYNSEALMLIMRWNLFRGGADQAQGRALSERRYAAIDGAANTRREVEERVALALNAKATSEERLAYLQEHAALSVEVLDSYQQQLELGRRSLLDLLNSENEAFSARSNLAAGIYEDLFNQFALLAAQGTLVKSLGITLPE